LTSSPKAHTKRTRNTESNLASNQTFSFRSIILRACHISPIHSVAVSKASISETFSGEALISIDFSILPKHHLPSSSILIIFLTDLLHKAQSIIPFPRFHELATSNAVNTDPHTFTLLLVGGIPLSMDRKASIAKFSSFIKTAGGGIFTRKTRRRLAGELGLSGRNKTKNQFWCDVRNRVRNALRDLELFIESADADQVNQVLTEETLRPVVFGLLHKGDVRVYGKMPDVNIAEIARLLVQQGFRCLSEQNKYVTKSHARTIEDALDLSNFLVETFKPESERSLAHGYVPPA